MGENVQCPVCTLYLHAGMNLSDHLETHPKEQVIKALVQMTITNVGGCSALLASVAKAESSNGNAEEKNSDKGDELNSNAASSCSVTSNCSQSNQSMPGNNNNTNNNNPSNIVSSHAEDSGEVQSALPTKISLKSESANKELMESEHTHENAPNDLRTYHNSSSNVELLNVNNNFAMFGNHRYHPQQRNQINSTAQMPPPPVPQGNTDIPRPILPPPPPPPQQQQSQSQSMPSISAGFSSLQLTHAPPPPPHHSPHLGNSATNSHHRQPHVFAGQQHTALNHHQQDIKVIYSSGLPPPPPLQLFSFQQSQQQQQQHHHQKPPPAYGTAISQIRSQNNQNKNNPINGTLPGQLHHMTNHHALLHQQQQQVQQHQQLIPQHHIRIHGSVPPSTTIAAGKPHIAPKVNDVPLTTSSTAGHQTTRPNIHHQHQNKYFTAPHQQQQQQQQNSDDQHQSQYKTPLNLNDVQNKSAKTAVPVGTSTTMSPTTQPQASIPTVASTSMAAVAASTLSRHTNSPFAALLAAAAGAPSPSNSSVLRYAESPVAHYLERDNGDFIVQETPKHIVECVEKDNGEFSVIERIYQSPPSVLHIHDDDDDDEEDDNGDDDNHDEEENNSSVDSQSKSQNQQKKRVSSLLPTKEESKPCGNANNKSVTETKKTQKKKNYVENSSSDNEITDYVSISSDSDEEEFISQERKVLKNTTMEKTKKAEPVSVTPTPASNAQSSNQSITDAYVTPSTSHSSTSNGTLAHQNSSRKKSSKNTVTVLSDVQLNLNEYLDLVGNIIASSKVAAQRRSFTAIGPIPLVKIEKEEPIDDYAVNMESEPPLQQTTLKANKQETEDLTDYPRCSSSFNKSTSNADTMDSEQGQDENKAQINETNQEVHNATDLSSSINKNSSQVTSVIRMASTCHRQVLNKSNESDSDRSPSSVPDESPFKIVAEAEDLSKNQRNAQPLGNGKTLASQASLVRKGPKKLVIKPKSIKKEMDVQLPSTSARAMRDCARNQIQDDETLCENDVQVKNEPITSITFEGHHYQQQQQAGLEQQLVAKEPILECKEEKPCLQEPNISTAIQEMKVENNVNDDARVLYDFATSKKGNSASNMSLTFSSATSLFAKNQKLDRSKDGMTEASEINNMYAEIETSSYLSQSAMDTSNTSEDENRNAAVRTSISAEHSGSSQVFSDFPFNYLCNSNNVTDQCDLRNNDQFSSLYQNTAININHSNHNQSAVVLEESSSSKNYSEYEVQQQTEASSQNQWLNINYQVAAEATLPSLSSTQSNSNMNTSMSARCSTALDSKEVSKYLDLDACKEEQNVDTTVTIEHVSRSAVLPPPPPSSSTSSSFTGATENSMVGICSTAGTLNIRTDEKMPAKGEISEQESNCDIDNSWSQPIYGDISARFFKTTFPGIFQQDNGWNHDEYFTVQDLSASTSQAVYVNTNKTKSFDFRLTSASNNTDGEVNATNSMTAFSQSANDNCHIDVMPSTSAKIKKRRKRNSQDSKVVITTNAKRVQPTSTITSQQMMESQIEVQGTDYNFQQQEHQPGTSSAFLAGPSNANMAAGASSSPSVVLQQSQQGQQQSPRIRTKVYECGHCNAKYSKLKDRNAHMVVAHNYVRQNRRLVCLTNGIVVPLTDSPVMSTSRVDNNGLIMTQGPSTTDGSVACDFKQGIVKIENENTHREDSGFVPLNADLRAKTEVMEDDTKLNLSIVPISSSTSTLIDEKPHSFQPLTLTTPTSKLTSLYRMLVTYNMTTLKQNQRLSDFDENLIKSSIFFCYICRQNFNSVKLYDAHLTEHPAECFTCGKKFQRWKNFSLHLKRHLGWKEFGCTICDKKFVVRSALVEHMRMHSGLSPLKCKLCGKHFKRYSNLTQHRKRHTKQVIRRKEYVCYCGEVLPSKARFLWHKETHDSKPKCCPHCCDRFVHVNSLRRHIRLAHSDKFDYNEPMECQICKHIFAKASMKAHMATHSTDTQYDCAICNKSFSTKWNLKIHSWVHANRTSKPFKCEHCPKAFVREVDFKNHMNSHKQIKPYTCEVCGCKFIRKYNYMRHRREHHGNKKYTCDLCKKSFHRHYYLIEHRRIHTGERPFQCTICGKSSTTKTNHNKHLKIHHSRDPFTVEV